MRYESKVIDAVQNHLKGLGWKINFVAYEGNRGDDIVAVKNGKELRIEAKGEGSSKPHTARFGKTFKRNQVKDHIANAFFRVAYIRESKKSLVGIALPDNLDHREMISRIENTIDDLGIILFWVSEDLQVSVEGANTLN
jgi:hypothetical protein